MHINPVPFPRPICWNRRDDRNQRYVIPIRQILNRRRIVNFPSIAANGLIAGRYFPPSPVPFSPITNPNPVSTFVR